MGVPIENATREAVLLPLKDDYPVVAKLLEYRAVQTSVASFGKSWLDLLDSNHRVFPDFAQIGAPTGRMSCSTPNVQQVPTAEEYRQCFDAPAGRSFVLADYSQIELRILAEFSGDEKFIDAFQSGSDLHRVTASQVFSVSIDDVTKDQRDFAKRLNFGVVYGIGAARFARMTGVSLNVAEEKLRKYFATYRKLDDYLREASNRAVNQRCTRTGSGRLIRFRFDPHDRQAVSEVRRRGRNSPIQGTGADILKRALRRLHDDLRDTTAKIVNIIHDEIVIECDDTNAPEIADRACKQMVRAGEDYLHNVPVVVEPKIARQWIK
jgi:DNA polymerase-1